MKTNTNDMDDLLVKQLTGEATPGENTLVQQWLAADSSNQHYFEHFKLIWEESVHLAATTTVDEQAAWQRFQNRVAAAPRKKAGIISLKAQWLRIAAIFLLISGIGILSYFLLSKNGEVTLATLQSTNNTKTGTLPDGSMVTLNKNSRLTYPASFTKKERLSNLDGEAFFTVTPDKKKPFLVKTGNIEIKVVGTSFNVRTKGDSTEVIVETGIVQVTSDGQSVTLQAGEKIIIWQGKPVLQKQENTDQLYNYYRSRKFICDETPLWKLVNTLNEAYNVHIVIERDELRDLPITTTFDNESLETILMIISETHAIDYVKNKEKLILR